MKCRRCIRGNAGFNTLEVMIVVSVALVVAVIGLPTLNSALNAYRISGNIKGVAESMALAKMRASANFSREQIQLNLTRNTYQLFTKADAASSYQADGGVQYLSPNVTFSYGSITAPAGGQTSISQSTTVTFNSRGIPIDDSTGQPKVNDAVYLGSGSGTYYAISILLSGRPQIWKYSGAAWVAQ